MLGAVFSIGAQAFGVQAFSVDWWRWLELPMTGGVFAGAVTGLDRQSVRVLFASVVASCMGFGLLYLLVASVVFTAFNFDIESFSIWLMIPVSIAVFLAALGHRWFLWWQEEGWRSEPERRESEIGGGERVRRRF